MYNYSSHHFFNIYNCYQPVWYIISGIYKTTMIKFQAENLSLIFSKVYVIYLYILYISHIITFYEKY